MEVITRKNAIMKNQSYYFTGIPCKHGHLSKRHITSCGCRECEKEFAQKPESKKKRAERNRTDKQKEIARQYSKKYHANHREECLKKMRDRNPLYYEKNSERIKKQALDYQSANATTRTKYKREWEKQKVNDDPSFKMHRVLRRMLHRALGVAGQVKYKRTQDYLPYSHSQLVENLETKFKNGMSWGNYGQWHIDHKIPLSKYIKSGIVDPAIINGLDNLQPLWASENMSKGNRV